MGKSHRELFYFIACTFAKKKKGRKKEYFDNGEDPMIHLSLVSVNLFYSPFFFVIIDKEKKDYCIRKDELHRWPRGNWY